MCAANPPESGSVDCGSTIRHLGYMALRESAFNTPCRLQVGHRLCVLHRPKNRLSGVLVLGLMNVDLVFRTHHARRVLSVVDALTTTEIDQLGAPLANEGDTGRGGPGTGRISLELAHRGGLRGLTANGP